MKHVQYKTHGTCSQLIDVTADDNNVIQQVYFLGGCNGNLQGICQLVKGKKIDEVIGLLDGIRCGTKAQVQIDLVRGARYNRGNKASMLRDWFVRSPTPCWRVSSA